MGPETRDRVEAQLRTDLPAAALWAVLAEFGGIANWLGGAEPIESKDDFRRFRIEGAEFCETLLFCDDRRRVLGYRLDKGPLPVSHYEATLRVTPRDDGAVISMVATYCPIGIDPEKCLRLLLRAFTASLADLEGHVRQGISAAPLP
ncbi:SRPBCC family protein [Szabonella alba]|uniref:SRPBCC family protein n=1 Tax=Szabonella alba TaxID=2804194 RepID=A0A8K0VCE1_9RHOB|nr:SRPBCC family protein [Szabonella alba]